MKSRDFWWAVIIASLACMVLSKLLPGCGLEPDKKVIIERPEPPPVAQTPLCEGEPLSAVRKLSCAEGEVGEIIEVCREDGKWYEASNSCKLSCANGTPVWAGDVEEIIVSNCAECHGGYRNYATVKNIATTGLGGAGGISKLEYYITLPDSDDRSMPKNRPNLPANDIQRIQTWIENGVPESGQCGEDSATIDLDYLETHMLEFLAVIPDDEEKANYRFFTMAHKHNQGIDLEPEFKAFNQAVNSISFDNEIYLCKPVDPKGALCAIDIRALKLTRHVFAQIEQANRVGFISDTTKGKIIRQLTRTDQPMFHHDVFIDTVFDNQKLYYEIMGFKDRDQMLALFGVDLKTQIALNDYKLIGTNESDISSGRNTRLIAIFEGEINGFDTTCHISFDNPALEGAGFDLFQSPFVPGTDPELTAKIFEFTASEYICLLPNRMQAFMLTNKDGVLQDFAPENIVFCNKPNCIDPTIENGIDCLNCHVDGFIPELDVIGDHIRTSKQFNRNEIELAKQVYLDNGRNAATFNLHNGWYREAMEKIGRIEGEPDHLTNGQLLYLNRQTLEQVAAFVFTSPEALKACIDGSQRLTVLLGGLITGAKVTHDTLLQALPVLLDECELVEDAIIPL